MAFEKIKENAENILEHTESYFEKNIEYYKLWVFKVAMKSITIILKSVLFSVLFFLILIFFSISAAFAIAKYFDSYSLGFLIVGGIYLIVLFLLFLFKGSIIEKPIIKNFSEIFFND